MSAKSRVGAYRLAASLDLGVEDQEQRRGGAPGEGLLLHPQSQMQLTLRGSVFATPPTPLSLNR